MNPLALPLAFQEGLCLADLFRALGFTAEEIFFAAQPGDANAVDVFIVLIAQGLRFAVRVGVGLPGSVREVTARWRAVAQALPSMRAEDLHTMRARSWVRARRDQLCEALIGKGFRPPRPEGARP